MCALVSEPYIGWELECVSVSERESVCVEVYHTLDVSERVYH